MTDSIIQIQTDSLRKYFIPLKWIHTLVIGSGAAGLNTAVQLHRNGIKDILILTQGLDKGTSINTGSDKQTYYKLSMCGSETDSPRMMAESYLSGGAMHGDIALIEAGLSPRAFFNLVNLGVPFPSNALGQFVGYKTDHDPRQRATSIGPYTSREMCRCLIEEVKRLAIPIREEREVVQLITSSKKDSQRVIGALVVDSFGHFEAYGAENIIFATGGPGGLYKTSVYPAVHSGGIGLALMAGAQACNLPESQYGLASTQFRWNVSGTYMQVIPRFISRAADGLSDEREFLPEYFNTLAEMNGNVFLKGYQWPFDARKVSGGSSIIDILVYIETMEKGRKVYLDFRQNPANFSINDLPEEAQNYLVRSNALQGTPIERLAAMNPGAIALYKEHDIDLFQEPLEIAVCAQHNNGGLAANIWWESTNLKHLFPIGEVNGTHGVNRPGGSALNSGQVGGFRAAEYISKRYANWSIDQSSVQNEITEVCQSACEWAEKSQGASKSWRFVLKEIQERMSFCGAHIRSNSSIAEELPKSLALINSIQIDGCGYQTQIELPSAFQVRQLCYTHYVYLSAIQFMLDNHVGSRGSAIVIDTDGFQIHSLLESRWKIAPEDPDFRLKILQSRLGANCKVDLWWDKTRPIPEKDSWFETTWADFRNGNIYD